MKIYKAIFFVFIKLCLLILVACEPGGDTQGLKDTLTVNALDIQSIYLRFEYSETLNSDSTYLGTNDKEQIFASANDPTGANINKNVTWSTSNSAIAQVDQNGLLTTTSNTGSVTVYATIGSVVSGIDVIVSNAGISEIKYLYRDTDQEIVDPNNNTVALCDSISLKAIGTFSDQPPSERVITEKLEWTMDSDSPEGGKVTNTNGNKGVFSAHTTSSGDPTILPYVLQTIYFENKTPDNLNLYVEQLNFDKVSSVSPEKVKTPKNDTEQYQATALFDGESKSITATAKWVSTDHLVADDPVNGLVRSKNVGTTDIIASCTIGNTPSEAKAVLEVTDEATIISLQIRTYSNNSQVDERQIMEEGDEEDYTVYALMSDGTSTNVSENAKWTVDKISVIDVNDEDYVGNEDPTEDRVRVTAQSSGSVDLTATYNEKFNFITFDVRTSQ